MTPMKIYVLVYISTYILNVLWNGVAGFLKMGFFVKTTSPGPAIPFEVPFDPFEFFFLKFLPQIFKF